MKKTLTRTENYIYHYKDGVRIQGKHDQLRGNVSGLTGNVSGLRGDVNVNGITGDVNGIRGDCTDIDGDLDYCKLTEEERKSGVDINTLVKEE